MTEISDAIQMFRRMGCVNPEGILNGDEPRYGCSNCGKITGLETGIGLITDKLFLCLDCVKMIAAHYVEHSTAKAE